MSVEKLLSIAGTALRSNVSELKKPYKLNFCVTYMCQSRCLTCNIWKMRPAGELSLEEIRKFVSANPYFKWAELTGGEPFLRGDIVDIVRTFKENSRKLYIVTMPTNSLCNHDMVERKLREILSMGIPRVAITVSLDGYRELHDKIRGIPGNYDRAMDMFRRLLALKKEFGNLYPVFGYTLSGFNKGQFAKTFEEVKKDIPEIRYNDFHINLAQVSDNYYGNTSNTGIRVNNTEVVSELESILRNRKLELGVIPAIEGAFLKKLVYYARTGRSPMHSRSLEASLYLDSFGNVYPSIMWDRKIGNVRDVEFDLMKLWHNAEAEKTREDIRAGREPSQWTSCEAYQTLTGNILSIFR